ncbi:MAG: hypothetical protein AB9895_00105 [Negativicutes bacterium]
MQMRHARVPYQLLDLVESNETKYIYLALLHFRSGQSKQIKVSLRKISELTSLKARQVTKHINTLIQSGMVSRKQIKYSSGEYSCNTYTLLCDERHFAEVPWKIAYSNNLSVHAKIGYCVLKRFIDLDKGNFFCYMTKNELAKYLRCSLNQVDKIKRNLKEIGLIDFERGGKKIVLVYERSL